MFLFHRLSETVNSNSSGRPTVRFTEEDRHISIALALAQMHDLQMLISKF
jgi:hypothetical protein